MSNYWNQYDSVGDLDYPLYNVLAKEVNNENKTI